MLEVPGKLSLELNQSRIEVLVPVKSKKEVNHSVCIRIADAGEIISIYKVIKEDGHANGHPLWCSRGLNLQFLYNIFLKLYKGNWLKL